MGRQFPRVRFLHGRHPRIVPKFPGQLPASDVHGVDVRGAVLQETVCETTGGSSEILVAETIRFIDRTRAAGKPFFTVVWFGSPHEPYSGLPADLALYENLPAKYPDKMVSLTSNETGGRTRRPKGDVLRERYAEITAMDRSIGTLRKHLAKAGLRDNTLLFYCGDNGTSADGSLVTPHRCVKGQVYDGGILVPGLI